MRLLFVSQVYSPEPIWKPHELASDLVARGHQVTVLTAFPNYPLGRTYDGYHQRLREEENVDGVRVVRVPLYPEHGRSAGKRAASYLSFAATASLVGPFSVSRPDVIWAFHPPLSVAIPALWLKLVLRTPVVYEIQDMWPETLSATDMVSSRTVLGTVGTLARGVYRAVNAIVVQSPGMKRNLASKGVSTEAVTVISNWADEDMYRPVQPDPMVAEREGLAGRFNVMFAGNLGRAQALHTLLDAAALLQDHPRMQFVIVGDGIDEPMLRAAVRTRNLGNVRFLGRRPACDMPSLFAHASVLFVHLKRDPLFAMTIPSKILAYLASGCPIVAAVEGDAADVVRNAKAGFVCPPEDPTAIVQALRALEDMSGKDREQLGRAGREAFLKDYTRRNLVPLYEALFRRVARNASNATSIDVEVSNPT